MLPRAEARARRYIQAQPPWLIAWLLYDIDRDGSWAAADDAQLPAPSFTCINRHNGHGHLGYGIAVPVRLGDRQSERTAHYAADVQRAMTVRLGADPAYGGFTVKNPLSSAWAVLWGRPAFTLGELQGWLGDLSQYHLPQRVVGVGRNVECFDAVRSWAYRGVLQHRADGGSVDTWVQACAGAAQAFTADNHAPALHRAECRSIGRSVGRWTWRRFSGARLSAIQAARGRLSGKGRRLDEEVDSRERTKPWVALGIGRATFYRKKAAGLVVWDGRRWVRAL